MKPSAPTATFARRCLGGMAAALLIAPAFAQEMSPQATYDKARAACMAGDTNQSKQDCLREAQSAYNEARAGKLRGTDPKVLTDNATQRCQVHKGADREACERLARGEGNSAGSVQAGGVLKELVTVEVGQPAAPADAPVPAPAPAPAPARPQAAPR